ncbi:hypothetical protein BGZ61DRAFT_233617 [Ilyonectria robusta]|uniref:uncharacterized protein n=1 Tax=Ilyonectria robusta TaxID=1079257 RepID=UPI001E8DF5C1|nr:uncharacterized protein BGZ61DRAFT_233617 [Ilyonectria robusta]KAH8699558.1 hypothetical protein BGZ61DRAFT_233617 [Ilyonectria robusta]
MGDGRSRSTKAAPRRYTSSARSAFTGAILLPCRCLLLPRNTDRPGCRRQQSNGAIDAGRGGQKKREEPPSHLLPWMASDPPPVRTTDQPSTPGRLGKPSASSIPSSIYFLLRAVVLSASPANPIPPMIPGSPTHSSETPKKSRLRIFRHDPEPWL